MKKLLKLIKKKEKKNKSEIIIELYGDGSGFVLENGSHQSFLNEKQLKKLLK